MVAHGGGSSGLNGVAVFAHKHALALAHASEGGKCNGVGKVALGQPKAGGSEYLELHGAFSIALRAPGAELLSKVWFPCRARSAGDCGSVLLCLAVLLGRKEAVANLADALWHGSLPICRLMRWSAAVTLR